MKTATQISSFLVPAPLWNDGHPDRPDLPPLRLPARDALAIERRASKKVDLHRESHRYILCWERMQGVVQELASEAAGPLPQPVIWPPAPVVDAAVGSAGGLMALVEALRRWGAWQERARRREIYDRVPRGFFPPDHAARHAEAVDWVALHPDVHRLLETASRSSILGGNPTMQRELKVAFQKRRDLVSRAAREGSGIVDVTELVWL